MNKTSQWPDYEFTVKGQFDAATPTHSAWVSANAGSGKTKVLIDRVARLLLNGVKPDAIMCVTYTKAAASEMQGRLFKRLGSWCVANDKELAKELADLQGQSERDYDADALGKARELFALALETPGGLRIETIHAFCGRLLRRFPLEARIAPGFKELDDTDTARLWDLALIELASESAHKDPLLRDALNTAALAAGGNGLGGPLRALLSKQAAINAFIQNHGGLDTALAVLQSEIGAGDQSVDDIIETAMGSAFPAAQLKNLLLPLFEGGKSDASTADAIEFALSHAPLKERFDTYKRIFLTGSGDFRKSNPYTGKIAKLAPDLETLFQIKSIPEGSEVTRMRNVLTAIHARETYERSAALLRISDIVFSSYAREKRRRAALDFDDLIDSASKLLTTRSMAQWVLWKLDGGLSHILLDEAQDTSPEQWRLLLALTAEFFSGQGVEIEDPKTLFVVGDEKQSIYSFQGADPEKFLTERQHFISKSVAAELDNKTPDILMSFRSAPQILSFVDKAFDADAFDGQAAFSMAPPEDKNASRHLPFRRDHVGCVELWPLDRPEIREDTTPWDAPLGQDLETTPKAELADRIAKWAQSLLQSQEGIWDDNTFRAARPGDILILVRGRKGGLFDAIIQALKKHNLPVAGADRIELLSSLAVQDLLNLIRFVLCPEDDLTLAEILTGPFGGLNENDHLFHLAHDRGDLSLWQNLQDNQDESLRPVKTFLHQCLERKHIPAFEFLSAALEGSTPDSTEDGWSKLQRRMGSPIKEPVTALLDRSIGFDGRGPASLQLFLASIETTGGEVKRELSGPQDEIRVMTVHGSKGLEAPIVVVPDTCSAPQSGSDNNLFVSKPDDFENAIPGMPIWAASAKSDTPISAKLRLLAEERALREHRRLLYVALTRAQDRLLICGPWSGGAKHKTGHNDKSWYATCHKAMQKLVDADIATIIALDDDKTIYRFGETKPADVQTHTHSKTQTLAPDWLYKTLGLEGRETRYAAPSSLLGNEPAVLPPFQETRPKQLLRGRLIHTLLQTLPDIEPAQRKAHAMHYLTRDKELTPEECEEMFNAANGVLSDPMFDPIFSRNGKAEAPIVGGNPKKLPANLMINGRVDRLVVTDDSVLIVDFKTDRPAPARVEDVGETYMAQLAAYRAVLESAYPDKKVRCALVWTDGPKLMELDSASMDKALSALTAL